MYNDLLDDIERDISGDWKLIQRKTRNEKYNRKYEMFFDILDSLIEVNKMNRKYDFTMPYKSHLREYCTIDLNIGRNIGKTLYIKKNAKENDVIIVNKGVNRFKDVVDSDVFSLQYILDDKLPHCVYENIWFDDFSYCNQYGDKGKYIKDYIYDTFMDANVEQTFIFLG